MKTNSTKKWMKVAGLTLAIGTFAFTANAQTAAGTDVSKTDGKTNSGTAAPVRVIDNKGTIKYLQVNNGLTQVVNSTAEKTTTTWQLGGTFTSNTTLDFNGKTFSFQSMKFNTDNAGANVAATASTPTSGYTILVRDEATGNILKMLATNMLQSAETQISGSAIIIGTPKAITDMPLDKGKVWVYRNGARLLPDVDYSLAAGTITFNDMSAATSPKDWTKDDADTFEIQWVK